VPPDSGAPARSSPATSSAQGWLRHEAIAAIRAQRPGSIETVAQEALVGEYASATRRGQG
jgi:protein-tyrosine phosphatase